jgi:hypothetical protein
MIYADTSCLLLMIHDEGQAKAAIEAGFEVVRPGRA